MEDPNKGFKPCGKKKERKKMASNFIKFPPINIYSNIVFVFNQLTMNFGGFSRRPRIGRE